MKHRRSGSLFEGNFKASRIDEDAYFSHITRYIHLNPRSWKYFKYSSINYYRKGKEPEWLNTNKVMETFDSRQDYMNFVYDYEDHRNMLEEIKYDLADN